MAVRRGINILDLLPLTTDLAPRVPDDVVEQIGVLTVLDHRSTTSDGFFLHEGTLQSIADALDVDTEGWAVRIPGLTHGLPFRLAIERVPLGASGQEALPTLWTLDIQVSGIEILIPRARAAVQVGGTGTTPLTLQPKGSTAKEKRVFLVAEGVVRASGGGPDGTQVEIVDAPDPFDPTAPTGAIIRLTARPASFLLGESEFGITLDKFVIDLSETFTPADIAARGHDETWQGVSFKELTFHFPPDTPIVHNLSVGARDVIIGSPGGLQGELRIEFGVDALLDTLLAIKQEEADGSESDVAETTPGGSTTALQYAITPGAGGAKRRVRAQFNVGASQLVPGNPDVAVVGVWWQLPDGTEGATAGTPWFEAPTSDKLKYRLRVGAPDTATEFADPPSAVPEGQTELADVTITFPATAAAAPPGGAPTGIGPLLDATVGAETLLNVMHLRGTRAQLATVTITTRGNTEAKWVLGGGSAPATQPQGATFALPPLPDGTTTADLVASNGNGSRRLRIEVVPQGPLAIGHQAGAAAASAGVVTIAGTGLASPTGVLDTFLSAPFHAKGDRDPAAVSATFAGTSVTVPQGTAAEVEVAIPMEANDPIPAPVVTEPATSRAVQILYKWDEAKTQKVLFPNEGSTADAAYHEPLAHPFALNLNSRRRPEGNDAPAQLKDWIAKLGAPNARKFFVVGRTDDLKLSATKAENDTYNNNLATARAKAARDALVAAGVPTADIAIRNETTAFTTAPPAGLPPRFTHIGRLALPFPQSPPFATTASPVFNRKWKADGTTSTLHTAAKDDPKREPYRCAEIFALDTGAPPDQPQPETPQEGVPARMLVPGADGPPPPPPLPTTGEEPRTDYRVRLRVKWDSPTVVDLADAIPTEAEALVAWKSADVELPPTASGPGNTVPKPAGQDFWEVLLHWTYDARTRQTEVSGALSLPDGTVKVESNALAGALALGPAITALANPADVVDDAAGQFVAAAAILAIGAAIGEAINTGNGPKSTVDLDKVAISYTWNGTSTVAATVDYTVDLHVNVGVQGAGSLVGHLRLKYKGVGLRFDGAPGGGLAGVALTYDTLSVEVVDPGEWSLGGPLGDLIRIAASRMGNGSQWMEYDLEFALDLGVVRLEGATIRLGLDVPDISVEFRGLAASIDIPGAVRGGGAVSLGDGGSIRALLALEVIPAKLGAYGALAIDQDFVSVEVGVQLPVGIPLAQTGLGIFGFMGRFVANGTRNLDGLTNPDPVQKQLEWYARSPETKYKRRPGQYAMGLGAVIGTLPDGGFIFNAEGSLTIGFPDTSVVFGIDIHLASARKSPATERGLPNTPQVFRILGMVLVEPDSVMVAARANYQIPKLLKLDAPISAFFPTAGANKPWYIRIGSDNAPTRPGAPVTLTLLQDTLNVRAWAFLMIEERGILGLGGSLVPADLVGAPLDFSGFSIGMGAGFDLKYKAGPFSIEVTAFLLVGMGTKPLLVAGAAGVKGEIDLVVVSLGVDGLLHFHISPGFNYIDGHFCASIDCWFFEVSGCVDVRFGDAPPNDIPEPESPLAGMDLCDHLAIVKGKARHAAGEPVPVVWPDTVAVLRFAHFIEDALAPTSPFDPPPPPAALSPWSGSTELKYAFRLKSVELFQHTGANPDNLANWAKVAGTFDSAWWMPTWRKAVVSGGADPGPSTEEGRELGLFSSDPRAWSRWLGEGSQDLPGNPANTVGEVCEPARPADPSCAYGKDRQHLLGTLSLFPATVPAAAVFPSRFNVLAKLPEGVDAAALAALGADAGWTYQPGIVDPLSGSLTLDGVTLTEGWRLPQWRETGRFVATPPIVFALSKPLVEGELVLEVCAERAAPNLGALCDDMPAEDKTFTSFSGNRSGAAYRGSSMQAFAAGGERALRLGRGAIDGSNAKAPAGVSVDLQPAPDGTTLTAFAADGTVLGRVTTIGDQRQTIRVDAPGVATMSLRGRPNAIVFEICWGKNPAILDLVPLEPLVEPRLVATDIHGKQHVLEGKRIDDAPVIAPRALARPKPCPKVRFALPRSDGWTKVELAPWTRGEVTFVALCGVTVEAATAQQADQDYRDGLKDLLNGLAQDAANNDPTHTVALEPASTYEIRVEWQYQGFRAADQGDEPGPPAPNGWLDPQASMERFRFATAAFGLAPAVPPPANTSLDLDPAQGGPGYDERTFDPRGITRYLTRSAPDHEDPPHFLDDHVGFWFMVDHLEALIEKYDRILQAKVLHTRPDAGTLTPGAVHTPGSHHPLDVTVAAAWQIDTLTWFEADHQLVLAAEASPCIVGTPAVGSSSVSVVADLKPHTEYDLMLNAAPKVVGAFPEVAIARSHFRTSRYRNPSELLLALGFAAPLGIVPPTDALATAALPAGALQVGDTELDAALTALGLDPWPLPAGPRTTVIWLEPLAAGQPWRVAAVLVEADEPVWRAGFKTGAQGEVEPPPRLEVMALNLFRTFETTQIVLLPGLRKKVVTTTNRTTLGGFTERVRNAAGTRSLFVPASPIAVANGRFYEIEMRLRENGAVGAKGAAPIVDRPLFVFQEGE